MSIPIPSKSGRAFELVNQQGQRGTYRLNPGLIFERFAPEWSNADQEKKQGLVNVRNAARHTDDKLLAAWCSRWQAGANAIHARTFACATDWRLIAGFGRKGPLEVGFTFHRYGFPYLPGSSLKGLARTAAVVELWNACSQSVELNDLDEMLAEPDDQKYSNRFSALLPEALQADIDLAASIRSVFGTQDNAGRVVFLDAIPDSGQTVNLELDILNPHYPDYYREGRPPTDWQNPIPVYFLAVAAGTRFWFGVGWRLPTFTDDDSTLLEKAEAWLQFGLQELGVGGKTSAGYGFFTPPEKPGAVQADLTASEVTPEPELPEETRYGKLVIINTDRNRPYGELLDAETGEKHRFHISAIHGNHPARNARVKYVLRGKEIIRVEKL